MTPGLHPPRRDTPRDPAYPTRGPVVARIARGLGTPLLPWQQHVADVTGERADGRYRYRYVVLRVPRRAGKTALALATMLARAGEKPRGRCWYTAQDRTTAAVNLRDDWAPVIEASPLAPHLRVRLSNGSEAVTWRGAGGRVALFAPGPRAIHSADADTVVVDEAWSFTSTKGAILEQGIRPAMKNVTRAPQLWIVSAGGTHESGWLHGWLDAAGPGVAVFDYSADPDVDDLDDPATLDRVHPAVGLTVSRQDVLDDRDTMTPAEWARAYLAVSTPAAEVVDNAPLAFDGARFADLADPDVDTTDARTFVAFDVAADRSEVAVVAGHTLTDGRVAVELVRRVPVGMAADYLIALRRRRRHPLIADAHGPTAALVDTITRRGLTVDVATTTAALSAAAALDDAITAGTVTHPGDPILVDAITTARRRRVGESWAVRRREPLDATAVAAALAHDAARVPRARILVM